LRFSVKVTNRRANAAPLALGFSVMVTNRRAFEFSVEVTNRQANAAPLALGFSVKVTNRRADAAPLTLQVCQARPTEVRLRPFEDSMYQAVPLTTRSNHVFAE
jgi:hypothetical protein